MSLQEQHYKSGNIFNCDAYLHYGCTLLLFEELGWKPVHLGKQLGQGVFCVLLGRKVFGTTDNSYLNAADQTPDQTQPV